MLLDEYQQHQRRIISHYARRSTSLSELQGRLKERGIKMKFTEGKNQRIVFSTQRNFRIDSKLGKDRVFTDIARKNVDRNAKLSKVSEQKLTPKLTAFEQAKKIRLEKSKDQIRDKSKSLGR